MFIFVKSKFFLLRIGILFFYFFILTSNFLYAEVIALGSLKAHSYNEESVEYIPTKLELFFNSAENEYILLIKNSKASFSYFLSLSDIKHLRESISDFLSTEKGSETEQNSTRKIIARLKQLYVNLELEGNWHFAGNNNKMRVEIVQKNDKNYLFLELEELILPSLVLSISSSRLYINNPKKFEYLLNSEILAFQGVKKSPFSINTH